MRRFNGDPGRRRRTCGSRDGRSASSACLPEGFQHVGGTYRTYGHGEPVDVWWLLAVPREEHPALPVLALLQRRRPRAARRRVGRPWKRTCGGRAASVATRYPAPHSPWKPRAVPLKDEIVGTAGSTLGCWPARRSAVLMLACVNVAGLLLGRAVARSREISVRAALGATRWRLARQLLIESLVLASAGGALASGLAYGAVGAVARFGPADMPRLR